MSLSAAPIRRAFDVAAHTINLLFLALFGYAMTFKVFDILRAGEISSELRIPIWIGYTLASLGILAAVAHRRHPLVASRRAAAAKGHRVMSEQTLVAIVGCVAVLVLMLIRVPIAVSLGSVAVAGFAYLVGPGPALGILINSPIRTVTNFNFSVMPMFILMGAFVSASGHEPRAVSRRQRVGRTSARRHGDRDDFACGGFAAINGSSIASAATMTQVALPEMRRAGYNAGLSAGVVAAGGTLGDHDPAVGDVHSLRHPHRHRSWRRCSSPASFPA